MTWKLIAAWECLYDDDGDYLGDRPMSEPYPNGYGSDGNSVDNPAPVRDDGAMTTNEMTKTAKQLARCKPGKSVHVSGLGNGRIESSATFRGVVNGHVVLEQGLTNDKVFVPMDDESFRWA